MSQRTKLPPYQRKRSTNSNSLIYYNNRSSMSSQIIPEKYMADLPKGMTALENQVAGHTFQPGTDAIGLLKDQHDGSIMKPATKPLCGVREITFYENLNETNDPDLQILKEYVPEYRGTMKLHLAGRDIDFIKLTDLTYGMLEPCIMDVKIGERTWDPLASNEKRQAEEQKYYACKKNLGLCIPGFQVYSINNNGKCKKYDKDYGKKLNEKSIKDALKKFLNADSGLCRVLLMKFLSSLWSIQKWARSQKSIKLYSSSLLLVYDGRRLRNQLEISKKKLNNLSQSNGSITPTSPLSSSGSSSISSPTHDNSINGTNNKTSPFNFTTERKISEPIQCYRKLQRTHSMQNNYDQDLKSIRQDYTIMLENLVISNEKKEWAYVKMIDFAHVFPSEDNTIDSNYLFGIDNLVKLFEDFLKECD